MGKHSGGHPLWTKPQFRELNEAIDNLPRPAPRHESKDRTVSGINAEREAQLEIIRQIEQDKEH